MNENTALVALPLPTLPKPWRDAQAIGHLAAGKSTRQVEAATGIDHSTVARIAEKHAEHLEQQKRAFQDNVLRQLATVLPARTAAASDAENRNGTQSAYWLTDILGWTGKAGGISISVGDTYNQALIVPPAEGMRPEVAERVRQTMDQFGI